MRNVLWASYSYFTGVWLHIILDMWGYMACKLITRLGDCWRTFFMQKGTIGFLAVVSQRTPLLCCGKERLLQHDGKGLSGFWSRAGLPWWLGAILKSVLKTKGSDAASFLSQGSTLPSFIALKMYIFTSIPATNILVNFMQSLSFFFVGMCSSLRGSVFCIVISLSFFFCF